MRRGHSCGFKKKEGVKKSPRGQKAVPKRFESLQGAEKEKSTIIQENSKGERWGITVHLFVKGA